MPGLSVVRGRDAFDDGAVDAALDALRFRDDYARETLYADGEYRIATTAYPSYPVRRVQTDGRVAVLDGELYDVPDAEVPATLERVGRWAAAGDDRALEQWLTAHDGDFVILTLPERGDATVVTDALGRLPTYRAEVAGATVVTREPKFVRELARRAGSPPTVDRLGVAQTLTFGYRLGSRTLFEGMERLPPAARLTLGSGDDGPSGGDAPSTVHVPDFGRKTHRSKSIEENATRLARTFERACRARADAGTTPVVSLSGGLDSRAVAAGLHAAGVPFVAATFAHADGGTDADVRAAREVSETLGVPWTPYRVAQRAANERRLLDEMQGTNSLAMGFVLDFLDWVAADYDDAVLVTGDGGDKAFPTLAPPRSFDSLDDLAAYVFDANAVFAPADAAAVARVDENRLRASVRERLASYPESSLRHRYVHFYVRERGVNWLNLGEDRNRRVCWSASPFYAYPFFADAMNCPDDQKARSRLYRRFVAELAPEVLDVTYADFGAPVASAEYAAKRATYDALSRYPRIKGRVLDLVAGGGGGDSDVARQLRARIATSDAVAGTFDVDAIARVLDGGSVNDGGVYDLLTLTSLVDDLHAGAEMEA